MKMREFMATMGGLMQGARRQSLESGSRHVFISDLHMGNGSGRDDFRPNRDIVANALEGYYHRGGWNLVLNGDIEELHKFSLRDIRAENTDLYELFDRFHADGRLVKIIGNHDLGLLLYDDGRLPLDHALVLDGADGSIMAFHGHQAQKLYMKYNYLSDFIVRYLADPLKIRNADIPMTDKRRFKAERRIYRASRELGVVTIAGHTHRPLFESYSKYDSLRWNIEALLRQYTHCKGEERERVMTLIEVYAAEFKRLSKKEKKSKVSRSLYEREDVLVPCMFNSGCATARGGFTALEIENGDIALVYWTREGAARQYIEREAILKDRVEGTPWLRYTIARDSLEYVFARMRLLAG